MRRKTEQEETKIVVSACSILFIIYYLLFIIYYLLFIVYYLLFIVYYFFFVIYYLLFIIYCLLFIVYYLLFIVYYLLFIIYCLLFVICFLTPYLTIASSRAMASWSGQLVSFEPHLMPLRRAITSSAFWPLINELMPCRLPWQPPAKATLPMVLSSLSSMSIRRLHVPLVV